MAEQIRRVLVWSGWLRVAHWSMAGSTLLLIATGWLVAHAPSVANAAVDLHYLAASVLIFSLVLRVFLGFAGAGAERFEHMLPADSEWPAMRASLLFYLSVGKAPLPNWYAHNPLWKPIYLVWFVLLGLLALTGWVMPDIPVIWRVYLPTLHSWLASLVVILTIAHLFSVVLQDVKGRGADISAMFSGHRFFQVDREAKGIGSSVPPQVSIRLDDIERR